MASAKFFSVRKWKLKVGVLQNCLYCNAIDKDHPATRTLTLSPSRALSQMHILTLALSHSLHSPQSFSHSPLPLTQINKIVWKVSHTIWTCDETKIEMEKHETQLV